MTLHRRTLNTLPALAALLFGCGTRVVADDGETNRQSLKGTKVLSVAVENLSADAAGDGLTDDQIRTDVALRLRKAGIVVSRTELPILGKHHMNPTSAADKSSA
jgi:hypothetical protein